MAWFGKSSHQKQVDAVTRMAANLYEQTTTDPVLGNKHHRVGAPVVLNFQLPDSRFRYMTFCLSTVITACARRMKNPDAVLNECGHDLIARMVNYPKPAEIFGEGAVNRQKVMNDGSTYLDDFLHRWSAYIDIKNGGNTQAATSIVATMLRVTESLAPAAEDDGPRLWPLAVWIEGAFGPLENAFVEASR